MQGYHEYTVSVFQSGGSQAIRLPVELRFPDDVKKVKIYGNDTDIIINRKKKKSLLNFFEKYKGTKVDQDFLIDREQSYLTEREERELF